MNCLECQELLQDRLDGASVRESESLDQHLNECTSCREQHAASLLFVEGLRKLPRPKPSAGFAQALASEVIRDRRKRRDKVRRGVLVTMALAASVMLILIAAYYWIPRTDTNKGGKIDVVKGQPKKETPPPKENPPEHVKAPEPHSPLTPVMNRLADTTRDHAKVVQVAMNLDAMENLPPAVKNLPTMEVREASQEVSDSVRTVTRNARMAFDFFARELPLPDMGELKH